MTASGEAQGELGPDASTTFVVTEPSVLTKIEVEHFERDFESHRNGDYELEATHERGLAAIGTAAFDETESKMRMEGTFAGFIEPLPSCVVDETGSNCDGVRVRGNFNVFPMVR